jgi:hypothetical protein
MYLSNCGFRGIVPPFRLGKAAKIFTSPGEMAVSNAKKNAAGVSPECRQELRKYYSVRHRRWPLLRRILTTPGRPEARADR